MNIIDYIQPELLILIPILYGIGEWIKAIPKIPNFLIPFILLGISLLLSFFHTWGSTEFVFSGVMLFTSIIQGVLIALATVGGNQLVKQIIKGVNENK